MLFTAARWSPVGMAEIPARGDADAVQVSKMATLFTPWSLRAAVTLRLPDLIADGVSTLERLATSSGSDADALSRLLRHLVNLGIVREAGPGRYELTGLGQVLRTGHPSRLAGFLDQSNAFTQRADKVVASLPQAVRTGSAGWTEVFGRTFWDDLAASPDLAAAFDQGMSVHAGKLTASIVRTYDWTDVRHVVDVGGGTGEVLTALLRANAHLRGTLVELPATTARARDVLTAAGVADRVGLASQSFFDPLPAGADVYLLTSVIHNWSDADGEKILGRCAEAAGPHGRVVLAELVIPEGEPGSRENWVVSQRDLSMLIALGGKERGEAEFRNLGLAAGLRLSGTTAVLPDEGMFLIEYRARQSS
jgi:2,7-dihydroxy-5-methyl-1-naphthoate 7-O-methyltransferase